MAGLTRLAGTFSNNNAGFGGANIMLDVVDGFANPSIPGSGSGGADGLLHPDHVGWMDACMQSLRSYFAIDNKYVKIKLLKLLMPHSFKNWKRQVG